MVSAIYKLYTSLLCKRLDLFLESKDLRAKTQCGFRSKHSTATAQFVLSHAIAKTCAHVGVGGGNKPLYVCFVDFQKAFDFILRDKLFDRLKELGIKGHMLSTIVHLYSTTSFKIKVNGIISQDKVITHNGVKQGCPLSPLLFGVFIDMLYEHLLKKCPNIGVQLNDLYRLCALFFADDVALIAESQSDLQALLDALATFCLNTKMLVNVSKTKFTTMLPWRSTYQGVGQVVNYSNQDIEKVTDFMYLGLLIDPRTWLKKGGESIVIKARRALGGVIKRAKQMRIENLLIMNRLYDSLVNSIALFGCQVWGVGYLLCDSKDKVLNNPPQILQLMFLRLLSGCHSKVCRMSLLKEFKIAPLQIRLAIACANFWNKAWLHEGITKVSLISDLSLFCKGYNKCWSAMFLSSMYKLGIISPNDWANIRDRQPQDFCVFQFQEALIKEKYMSKYENLWPIASQDWEDRMTDRSGASYVKYTAWFHLEECDVHKHFLANLSQCYMKTLIKFRLCTSPLAINDHSTPRDRRVCFHCSTNLEDEKHFIFNCPAYNSVRECPTFAPLWSNSQNMKSFFSQDDQCNLGKALQSMFKIRSYRLQHMRNSSTVTTVVF